ncbi:hypothetical protein Rt10032_c26g6808 [Rhodotorula toruloides]|uniref:Secreted protein n=1 Tax=Rhodotorula toruloides TaxID=5286 RepID=A0A511KR02_RHOTO|nr:hypothetical protein Rt10032_c26g6808 [Rhodotorula toruloides]
MLWVKVATLLRLLSCTSSVSVILDDHRESFVPRTHCGPLALSPHAPLLRESCRRRFQTKQVIEEEDTWLSDA